MQALSQPAAAVRVPLSRLHGYLNLNKPAGLTCRVLSNVCLAMTKHRLRVGHAGTLDPLAHGVVPIALGNATRLLPYLPDTGKTYEAHIKFGVATSSDDVTGIVQEARPVPLLDTAAIEHLLQTQFVGHVSQVPPALSAVRLGGRRAYNLVRVHNQPDVQLPSRMVHVHSIKAQHWCNESAAVGAAPRTPQPHARVHAPLVAPTAEHAVWLPAGERASRCARLQSGGLPAAALPPVRASAQPQVQQRVGCAYPELVVTVECGPGVYVRSLARDVGRAHGGTPSTLSYLCRTRTGGFHLAASTPLYQLRREALPNILVPADAPFASLPAALLCILPSLVKRPARAATSCSPHPQRLVLASTLAAASAHFSELNFQWTHSLASSAMAWMLPGAAALLEPHRAPHCRLYAFVHESLAHPLPATHAQRADLLDAATQELLLAAGHDVSQYVPVFMGIAECLPSSSRVAQIVDENGGQLRSGVTPGHGGVWRMVRKLATMVDPDFVLRPSSTLHEEARGAQASGATSDEHASPASAALEAEGVATEWPEQVPVAWSVATPREWPRAPPPC